MTEDLVLYHIARGLDLPEGAPPLIAGLEVFLTAFWELDRERESDRLIRPSVIDAWLAKYRITDAEFADDLHHHITALDIEYLTLMRERRKREESEGPIGNVTERRHF
jgi:hypothetical protein